MWLEEVLHVFTGLTAIKPLLQNHFVNTLTDTSSLKKPFV